MSEKKAGRNKVKSYHRLSEELSEAVQKKSMPMCWYLSRPTSKEFIKMAKAASIGSSVDSPPELQDLWNWLSGRWTDEDGLDTKKEIVKGIVKIASCKDRADWTYGKGGVAYRGFARDWEAISKYNLTGEVIMDGSNPYFVAKGKYKAKTSAQSWTASKAMAFNFAHDPLGVAGLDAIPVVVVGDIPKKDTLFNPEITNKIYVGHESEIIRVSNTPLDVTLYIKAHDFFVSAASPDDLKNEKTIQAFLIFSLGKEAGSKAGKNKALIKSAMNAGKK